MSQSKALYRLQKLDLEMDARRNRVREINAELEEDAVLRAAQAEVERLQNVLRPQETHVTDLNLEIKTVSSHSQQLNERLYGGKITNPKEMEDVQGKMAELKRRREKLENSLLETMIQVDESADALAQAAARLKEIEHISAAEHKALKIERKRLKEEFQTLKESYEAALQDVTQESLALYKSLRTAKHGYAVAVLEGDSCSGCRVRAITTLVQRVRQDTELVCCSNCGRILIAL